MKFQVDYFDKYATWAFPILKRVFSRPDYAAWPLVRNALFPGPVDRLARAINPASIVLNRHRRRRGIMVPTLIPDKPWVLVTASWCERNSMRLTKESRQWFAANCLPTSCWDEEKP